MNRGPMLADCPRQTIRDSAGVTLGSVIIRAEYKDSE